MAWSTEMHDILVREHASSNYKAAKVLMLIEVHDIPIAMLEEFSLKSVLSRGFTKWSTKNTVEVLTPLEDILDTCTHTILRAGKDVMTILHPPDYR